MAWTPSTNLAEISDWLTKLLLGAGLVGLTSLGAPTAALVRSVARGMSDPDAPEASGASLVAAAAVLLLFTVLGFVMGYVLTTLWYSPRPRGPRRTTRPGEMVVAPPVDAAPRTPRRPAQRRPGSAELTREAQALPRSYPRLRSVTAPRTGTLSTVDVMPATSPARASKEELTCR